MPGSLEQQRQPRGRTFPCCTGEDSFQRWQPYLLHKLQWMKDLVSYTEWSSERDTQTFPKHFFGVMEHYFKMLLLLLLFEISSVYSLINTNLCLVSTFLILITTLQVNTRISDNYRQGDGYHSLINLSLVPDWGSETCSVKANHIFNFKT